MRSMQLPPDRLRPHPDRLDPAHPLYAETLAAHEEAVRAGQPLYLDPITGLWVMTARSLWERGFCCELGCRHCPYVER
jgi:uncharacterized protein DUF5522